MTTRHIMIQNRTGLHARPASEFVALAAKFKSKITIRRLDEEDETNAKSIMLLLALGLGQGEDVVITAKGEDEAEAVEALAALVASKFGEE